MKIKVKIYIIGQKYEIELEEGFYNFIKDDINRLNNSQSSIKDLLNLMLSCKAEVFKNQKLMQDILQKIDK